MYCVKKSKNALIPDSLIIIKGKSKTSKSPKPSRASLGKSGSVVSLPRVPSKKKCGIVLLPCLACAAFGLFYSTTLRIISSPVPYTPNVIMFLCGRMSFGHPIYVSICSPYSFFGCIGGGSRIRNRKWLFHFSFLPSLGRRRV